MVATGRISRILVAAFVMVAVGWGGVLYAANQSVQGAKKEEGGFDGDAPTAILIEAASGSVLFEKNADELRAPSSMMKLVTVEVVFHALKEGKVKLSDEYRIGPWGDSPTHKVVFDSHNIEVGDTAVDGVELTPRAMASILPMARH